MINDAGPFAGVSNFACGFGSTCQHLSTLVNTCDARWHTWRSHTAPVQPQDTAFCCVIMIISSISACISLQPAATANITPPHHRIRLSYPTQRFLVLPTYHRCHPLTLRFHLTPTPPHRPLRPLDPTTQLQHYPSRRHFAAFYTTLLTPLSSCSGCSDCPLPIPFPPGHLLRSIMSFCCSSLVLRRGLVSTSSNLRPKSPTIQPNGGRPTSFSLQVHPSAWSTS